MDGDLSETEEPQEPDGDETTDDSTLGNTDEGDTDSDEGTDDTENDTTSDELDTSALTEDQKTCLIKLRISARENMKAIPLLLQQLWKMKQQQLRNS